MRVVLHPEARDELRHAVLWYDERRPGPGAEFVAEVSAVLERIAIAPDSFPSWSGVKINCAIRRAVLRRFPYVIAFETPSKRIVVLAVAHAKRRPLYWLSRASGEQGRG